MRYAHCQLLYEVRFVQHVGCCWVTYQASCQVHVASRLAPQIKLTMMNFSSILSHVFVILCPTLQSEQCSYLSTIHFARVDRIRGGSLCFICSNRGATPQCCVMLWSITRLINSNPVNTMNIIGSVGKLMVGSHTSGSLIFQSTCSI